MNRSLISQFQSLAVELLLLAFVMGAGAGAAFGQTLTTLHNFGASPTDGVAPGTGVILDKAGNAYGNTGVGGFQGADGTVFKLTPPASGGGEWTETILHLFHGKPDGKIPEGRLAMNAQGILISTTLHGGTDDLGTVYALIPPTGKGPWKEKIVHSFGTVTNDVSTPNQGVFIAPEGFYSVDQGGANNTGAFYLLSPAAGGASFTQHILYSFGALGSGDGADPAGGLVRDSKGNFYGVTGQGGANNLGAVYELSPPKSKGGAWTESVIFSFDGTNGTLPAGPLLLGTGGILYGTTNGGGDSGAGLVFQLTPPVAAGNAWTESVLYTFTGGNDGGFPESGVVMDTEGNLLGSASNAIFQLTPPQSTGGAWTESVLHNFTGPDGFIAGPITLSNGAVYGTTQEGGAFGVGTAFQLTLP
jgi:uncharacterized repeat protein (TIGR03803 family)